MRHPGYLGFALWAAGTQLLLANPACLCVFVAVVSVVWHRTQRRDWSRVELHGKTLAVYGRNALVP